MTQRLLSIDGTRRFAVAAFLWAACAMLTAAQAEQRGVAEVQAAVETWVRSYTPDAKPDARVVELEPHIVGGEVLAYIAHLVPEGYCLCGADDLVLPVYLYSPAGVYEPEGPGVQCALDEIVQRTQRLRELVSQRQTDPYEQALARNEAMWDDLAMGLSPYPMKGSREVPEKIALPLTCYWRQGSPYNDQCPELIPGTDTHAVVGCVPTAAVQTMYFWQWPPSGEGVVDQGWYPRAYSTTWLETPLPVNPNADVFPGVWESISGIADAGKLEWTSAGGGVLRMTGVWDVSIKDRAKTLCSSAEYRDAVNALYGQLTPDYDCFYVDYGASTYDWGILADSHSDPPGAAEAELSKLCFHAGVAIGVRYGKFSTNGNTFNVPAAMVNHFHYDADTTCNGWSGQSSIDAITDELKWYRPVIVGGCGHAWLIYGYDSSYDPHRRFLMNMGWGESTHAKWYTCDGTEPDWCSTLGEYQMMIAPHEVVQFVSTSSSGDGSPDDPHGSLEESLDNVPWDGTLVFKAASTHHLSGGPITIDQAVTLKGYGATIGAP